jgi:hypothetical protein
MSAKTADIEGNPSMAEAQVSILEANQATQILRSGIENRVVGPILVAWGVAWMACYSAMSFSRQLGGVVGMIAFAAAGLATSFVARGRTAGSPFRLRKRNTKRMVFHFVFWPCIAAALLIANRNQPPDVAAIFNLAVIGIAYSAYGLLLALRTMIYTGLILLVVAAAGYLIARDHLFLWSAIAGGLGFAVPGSVLWRNS